MADAKFDGDSYTQLTRLNIQEVLRISGEEFSGLSLTLLSYSTAAAQEPAGLDNPMQVEFGTPSFSTGDVEIAPDGTITFVNAGTYMSVVNLEVGRTSNNGEADIYGRGLRNGVQVTPSRFSSIDATKFNLPMQFVQVNRLEAGDTSTVEIVRDSNGVDDGGLYQRDPTLPDWLSTATASIVIYKLIGET